MTGYNLGMSCISVETKASGRVGDDAAKTASRLRKVHLIPNQLMAIPTYEAPSKGRQVSPKRRFLCMMYDMDTRGSMS